MNAALHHAHETRSNPIRDRLVQFEPRALRTYTPTQVVIAKSAGVFHWTPEGKRLYDFTSGVLVANLGHNPRSWLKRYTELLGHPASFDAGDEYIEAVPMTAYNAVTPIEIEASERLVKTLQGRPGGQRFEQILWAASGSEAIQKALWASLARDRTRSLILATRFGFHGKKGLAGAVTGSETDSERDPRVRFIGFPMAECADVTMRNQPFDPAPYRKELDALWSQFGRHLSILITEPYLGGGGSYHPHKAYLRMLQEFCREHDLVFILDEVQANFGRTGDLFAYETYGLEPDIVVLGKGLGNGVPVSIAAGSKRILGSLQYGEGSDTWSANPLCCAAVLATLEAFADGKVLKHARRVSAIIEQGLLRLKEFPFVSNIRGENGGMVWGIEFADNNGHTAAEWANEFVLSCYRGEDNDGIHLLGPLAKKVVRIAPPLVLTETDATTSMELLQRCAERMATKVMATV